MKGDIAINKMAFWFFSFVFAGVVGWTGTTIADVSVRVARNSAVLEQIEGRLHTIELELLRQRSK